MPHRLLSDTTICQHSFIFAQKCFTGNKLTFIYDKFYSSLKRLRNELKSSNWLVIGSVKWFSRESAIWNRSHGVINLCIFTVHKKTKYFELRILSFLVLAKIFPGEKLHRMSFLATWKLFEKCKLCFFLIPIIYAHHEENLTTNNSFFIFLKILIFSKSPTTPSASPRQGTRLTRLGPKAPDREYSRLSSRLGRFNQQFFTPPRAKQVLLLILLLIYHSSQ